MKTCARLSSLPDAVVVNSLVGKANHETYGYHPRRWEYIPNGIDTALYFPNSAAGSKIRAEWGVSETEKLIGLVGRLDPQKDHPSFLNAAKIVLEKLPGARFVCVGDGPKEYRAALENLTGELKIDKQLLWAGLRKDMPAIYNALDLLVLASAYGEGFPNAVAEAMACGTLCVVTNVGDAAMLVENSGLAVPPKSPQALADAILQQVSATENDLEGIQEKARQTIAFNFDLLAIIQKYETLYQELTHS
jgi:glycosyltransferase involved in cell wall biosynthesis